MLVAAIRKYRKMIIASLFFFYLGCGITLTFFRLQCVEGARDRGHRAAASEVARRTHVGIEGVEYAVLVLTGPRNVKRRDAIRMTWGSFVDNVVTVNGERLFRWNHTRAGSATRASPRCIKIFFAVGTRDLTDSAVKLLEVEAGRTDDLLLLEDVEDSYERLTNKLMASLRWLHAHAQQLKYVIKCDDDSFVRVDRIVSELDTNGHYVDVPQLRNVKDSPHKGLFWGYFNGRASIYLSGKWKEEDWFLCDHYLPYANGGGYVVSHSIVAYIAKNSELLRQYNSEDVSMGVWTSALDGINRVHDVRFDTQWKSRGCQDDMLVRHKQTPSDMFTMYSTLVQTKGKNLCKSEWIDRKPYYYNWNVLPGMCCKY